MPIPFNITVGGSRSWPTDTFTYVEVDFSTPNTGGSAVFTDMTESKEFQAYTKPSMLKEYSLLGVFQFDMRGAKIPSTNAIFSFTHKFSFGILNVNPKEMCIVGVDMNSKQITKIDFSSGPYDNKAVLPLKQSIYTLGVMGIVSEIPAQYNQPVLVNYRASLKYDVNPNLKQFLSVFINRSLKYPAHEYVTSLIDNKVPLPSKDMVEIMSFTFSPMLPPSLVSKLEW